jgi:hypothetical protein
LILESVFPKVPGVRALPLLCLLALSGCAPKLTLWWTQPPRLPLSPGDAVAVRVDPGADAPAAVEPLTAAVSEQVTLAGYHLASPEEAALVIAIEPTGWRFTMDAATRYAGGRGKMNAKVTVTRARASDAAPVFTETYWATQSVNPREGEAGALKRTATRIVRMILSETKAAKMTARVVLDDSDPVVAPGLKLCKQNKFKEAYESFAAAITEAPGSPAAHYNFGVMAEIQNLYDIAENSVNHALVLQKKPMYEDALQRIRDRRADFERLKEQRAQTEEQQPAEKP